MLRLSSVSLLGFWFISCFGSCSTAVYPYKTLYFDQIIDHFNFASHGNKLNKTFKQRYLVSDKHWSVGKGPIFFYTGNEGPITSFLENTGLMFDIAPEFNALLIFAEHRFYGETLPFGDDSFTLENLGLLTIEQALTDYAELILFLKQELKCPDCKVVTFGGSYGGMLSAYMRFKYPNTVDGAIASSAPIYSAAGQGSQSYFFEDVTKSFGSVTSGKACVATIRQAFITMNELADQGIKGLNEISSAFKLCRPLQDKTQIPHLQGWVRNAFTSMAMVNYPYPASFLGQLPAWPVNASCYLITSAKDPLEGLAAGAGLFYNGTKGSLKCMDVDSQYVECSIPSGCGLGNDAKASDWLVWDSIRPFPQEHQSSGCTEVTFPDGTNNVTDMFPVLPFTPEMREAYCKTKWNVVPKPTWLNVIMWGEDIKSASNIIFCNGALDPWRDGGVLRSPQPGSLDAFLIADGAHHLDLRGANPADPESVKLARQLEKDRITAWIK